MSDWMNALRVIGFGNVGSGKGIGIVKSARQKTGMRIRRCPSQVLPYTMTVALEWNPPHHVRRGGNMPTSSVYKYLGGKSAILAAIYRRATYRVSGDASTILAAIDDPAEGVTQFVDAYVDRSFAQPELAYVYYVERGNVP